jgi:hypothetical protein
LRESDGSERRSDENGDCFHGDCSQAVDPAKAEDYQVSATVPDANHRRNRNVCGKRCAETALLGDVFIRG